MQDNSVDNPAQLDLFDDGSGSLSSVTDIGRAARGTASRSGALRDLPEFRVVRSTRRKRSIQAFRTNGIIEIHMPAKISRRQENELIPEMIAMVLEREARARKGDEVLLHMSAELLGSLLPEFSERPSSVTWRPMRERWGSCTTLDRTIRISQRLNNAPEYALKYVLFHELVHLRIAGHDDNFYELLERYPDKERAEAFLEGYEAGIAGTPDEISLNIGI